MPPEADDSSLDAVAAAIRAPAPEAKKPEPAAAPPADDGDDLLGESEEQAEGQLEEQAEEGEEGEEEQAEEGEEEQAEEEEIDVDEIPIEVTIDGETKEVPLKELKANYSGEKAIEKRLQEATEVRQQVYAQGQTLYQALDAVGQRLQYLDNILAQSVPEEINWDELRAKDPARYLLERDKFQIAQQKREAVQRQQAEVQQQQEWLQQQYMIEVAKEQAANLLKEMPELRDPEKGPAKMKAMVETAGKFGFTFEEVRQVLDSRQLKVLARLAELEAKEQVKPKLVPKAPRPLSKPGSRPAGAPMTDAKKQQLAALKRARNTGRVEDVASLLLVRRK